MLTCSFFFSPASAGFPPSFHNCSLFSLLNNLFFMAGFISPASFHKKARLPTFLSLLCLSKYVCNLAFLFFLLHLIAGFITTVVLFASVCTIHTLWRLFLLRESLSRLRICTVRIRKLFLYVCFIFESQGCCLVSTLILLSTLVLLSHRCFRCQSVSASRSFYFSTVLRIRRSFYSREEYFRLFHLCLVSVEQIQIKAKSIIAYLHSKLITFEDRFMENLNGKGSI